MLVSTSFPTEFLFLIIFHSWNLSNLASLVPCKFSLYGLAPTSFYKEEFDQCLCDYYAFHYCPLHAIPCSLHHLSNPLSPLGSFSPDTFFLFWVLVFNVHVLGQAPLLASDTPARRPCGRLGAASIRVTKPRPQPRAKGAARGYRSVLPPHVSYETDAPALNICCLWLSRFLPATAAASAPAVKEPQVTVLIWQKKIHLNYTR